MGKNTTIKEIQLTHDLTSGAFSYTSTGLEGLDNYTLKMIKIKSTNPLLETLTITSIEKTTTFNTVLYTKTYTSGTNIVITSDVDFIFKEGSKCKIDITNGSTVGNIYVTLYFDSI